MEQPRASPLCVCVCVCVPVSHSAHMEVRGNLQCVCVCVCVCVRVSHSAHMEVRGQLTIVSSFLLPYGSWGLSLGQHGNQLLYLVSHFAGPQPSWWKGKTTLLPGLQESLVLVVAM